jgi:hypothetical protein
MQIQNKYKHLHYLVCLGSGLRKANADIVGDALPDEMQAQLERLAHQSEPAEPRASGQDRPQGGRRS